MKRRIDGKVYLQRYDLDEIVSLDSTPKFVINEITDKHPNYWQNKRGKEIDLLFDQAFEGRVADWIMEQQWIIDFDEYKDKRWQEVYGAYFNVAAEIETGSSNRGISYLDTSKLELEHKLVSLKYMTDYTRGMLEFELPK
jgi:hypothetical protein